MFLAGVCEGDAMSSDVFSFLSACISACMDPPVVSCVLGALILRIISDVRIGWRMVVVFLVLTVFFVGLDLSVGNLLLFVSFVEGGAGLFNRDQSCVRGSLLARQREGVEEGGAELRIGARLSGCCTG